MERNKKRKILVILLIAITFIVVGGFIIVKTYTSTMVKNNIELGNKNLQEGKYNEATSAFNKVISIDAKNEQANERLSIIKNYQEIKKLYDAEDYKAASELISETKAMDGFNLIEATVTDINKKAESKLQVMKEIDDVYNVVEKLIVEKKFEEVVTLVNKYNDKDLTKEYKQKLEDLLFKINKAKSDYEEQQKKLEEENKKDKANKNGSLTMVEARTLLGRHDSDRRIRGNEGKLIIEDGRECWQFSWIERLAVGSVGFIYVDVKTGEVKNSMSSQWRKLE